MYQQVPGKVTTNCWRVFLTPGNFFLIDIKRLKPDHINKKTILSPQPDIPIIGSFQIIYAKWVVATIWSFEFVGFPVCTSNEYFSEELKPIQSIFIPHKLCNSFF
jgi:hypothetical protein